jgi:hypothetical protein
LVPIFTNTDISFFAHVGGDNLVAAIDCGEDEDVTKCVADNVGIAEDVTTKGADDVVVDEDDVAVQDAEDRDIVAEDVVAPREAT